MQCPSHPYAGPDVLPFLRTRRWKTSHWSEAYSTCRRAHTWLYLQRYFVTNLWSYSDTHSFSPSFASNHIIGHHFVRPDCKRFNPKNAVKRESSSPELGLREQTSRL